MEDKEAGEGRRRLRCADSCSTLELEAAEESWSSCFGIDWTATCAENGFLRPGADKLKLKEKGMKGIYWRFCRRLDVLAVFMAAVDDGVQDAQETRCVQPEHEVTCCNARLGELWLGIADVRSS